LREIRGAPFPKQQFGVQNLFWTFRFYFILNGLASLTSLREIRGAPFPKQQFGVQNLFWTFRFYFILNGFGKSAELHSRNNNLESKIYFGLLDFILF